MLLLAVLAGIAAGTAGCKQQDAPKLDRQAVRLYVGDQVRITADRPVAWSAADDFYAAVDADGTVTAVGESSSYGKYITVAHEGGYSTLYAHCSRIIASSGASVKEGDVIAEVGETGVATGPHLHFELHEGSQYLNPIYYVSLA